LIHFYDVEKEFHQLLFSQGYEANMEEPLVIEESAMYWLHNNTIVPTTTQRTTELSSSSTTNKSIFSTSIANNAIEKITPKTAMDLGASKSDAMNDDTENEINDGPTNAASKLHYAAVCTVVLAVLSFLHGAH
jgi:hypothetical protein